MIKLSIIIPMYNTEPYIDALLKALDPQLTPEVELIVVDDGSNFPFLPPYPSIKVFRHDKNKGVSAARNTGLKKAKGKYIAFIDSDDKVADDYISRIMDAIKSKPDTVYLSWKSMDGRFGKIIKNQDDKFGPKNRCVWNRVFAKSYIEGMTFDETLQVAEDDDFLNRLPEAKSHTYISEPVYFYRVGRQDGLSMRNARGEFAEPDVKTQVVLYYNWIQQIGGVETFFYNFCEKMSEYYDIAILYNKYDARQLNRLRRLVPCYKNDGLKIQCDTLIINGIFDTIPQNVTAKQTIRLVHTCQYPKYGIMSVPNDCDKKIFVSESSRTSFKETGEIIHNIPGTVEKKKALVLVSATRLTNEKGYDRMLKLADRFRALDIPFVWLVFTAHNDKTFPEGFAKLPPTLNIKPFIAKADYLVQLSDVEAFCYSIQEALQLKVPVLVTPLEAAKEVGVVDGKNGYVLPFEIDKMSDDDVKRIFQKVPKFLKYETEEDSLISKWREVFGDTTPTHSYKFDDTSVMIRCKVRFQDVVLNKRFLPGEVQTVDAERGKYLVETLKAWEYVR